jgi:hypothetical protein
MRKLNAKEMERGKREECKRKQGESEAVEEGILID